MIVELAGLPGTGKTTIARSLDADDPTIRRCSVRPSWLVAVRHPCHAARTGHSAGWWRSAAWRAAWLHAIRQRGLRDRRDAVLLLEEGVAHQVWRQLFLHPPLEAAPWAQLLTSPHLLLVLETDDLLRFHRLGGKSGKGPVNHRLLAAGIGGADWLRAKRLWETVLAEAERRRPVLRVRTVGRTDEAVMRVREAITAIW